MTDTRVCKTCEVEKPLDDYRLLRGKHLHKCRECTLEANRVFMRGYRKKRTAERRAQRLADAAQTYGAEAKPTGRPSYQQRIDALEAQVQTILAILDKHGYNTTET